jgi:hypothetical protein
MALQLNRGNDHVINGTMINAPAGISGWTLNFTIAAGGSTITKTTADAAQISITSPSTGLFEVYIAATDTATLAGSFTATMTATYNGKTYTLAKDTVSIEA